jgi:hypothetical protein
VGGARRCSTCGITYPTTVWVCLVCEEETWFASDMKPDGDWKDEVAAQKDALSDYLDETQLYRGDREEEMPDIEASVIAYKDLLWVPHQQLLFGGYRHLEDFNIVLLNGVYYELQAHVGKLKPEFPGGIWWVETVSLEWNEEDWPVLSEEPVRIWDA